MAKVLGAVLLAAIWFAPASAADLGSCAVIADDGQRLACYDKLAGRDTPTRSEAPADQANIQDEIIERCQERMGNHGPAMVKGCVDMDMEAHAALIAYPKRYKAIVDRCMRRMGSHGWAMVRGCADMDIDAAQALERMKKR